MERPSSRPRLAALVLAVAACGLLVAVPSNGEREGRSAAESRAREPGSGKARSSADARPAPGAARSAGDPQRELPRDADPRLHSPSLRFEKAVPRRAGGDAGDHARPAHRERDGRPARAAVASRPVQRPIGVRGVAPRLPHERKPPGERASRAESRKRAEEGTTGRDRGAGTRDEQDDRDAAEPRSSRP